MKTVLMMATYNRHELTERMLGSLWTSTKHPFKMVIIDNGSTDGTVDILNSYEWPVETRIIFNPENKGIAIARNQALKAASDMGAQWYCTIDNDVEMPFGWLEECIDILTINRNYGAIGVNMEDKPYPIIEREGKRFQDKPQGNLGTACMVFPKSIHKMLGFFNTEYGPYGEEDADFGMRIRVAGFRLGYIERTGTHFGVGAADEGEYREFKTNCHRNNLKKFNQNVRDYYSRRKALFIKYHE
ncbi:MAG: glycosyltransferase [Thioploca sp.]|nr:glycosyltransferase [Thioploca sp.]